MGLMMEEICMFYMRYAHRPGKCICPACGLSQRRDNLHSLALCMLRPAGGSGRLAIMTMASVPGNLRWERIGIRLLGK